jgi:hypothetical protein
MRLIRKGVVPMSRWSIRRSLLAMLPVALLASACTTAGPSGSGAAGASDSTPPPTVATSAVASAASTPSAVASAASEPPAAALAVEGGDPVTGQLGSFTWGDGGSDSPWLPGSPIAVGAGEQLTVALVGGVGVATWSATRVPAGTTDGSGAVGLGTGGPPIAFEAPEPGSWSVQVTVDFDGGLGSASYYWLVTVR